MPRGLLRPRTVDWQPNTTINCCFVDAIRVANSQKPRQIGTNMSEQHKHLRDAISVCVFEPLPFGFISIHLRAESISISFEHLITPLSARNTLQKRACHIKSQLWCGFIYSSANIPADLIHSIRLRRRTFGILVFHNSIAGIFFCIISFDAIVGQTRQRVWVFFFVRRIAICRYVKSTIQRYWVCI